jgi:hypothetical protein
MKRILLILLFVSLAGFMYAQDEEISKDVKGTLYKVDGTTIFGDFIVNFREGYVPPRDEFGGNMVSLDGEASLSVVYYYPYKKRFKYKTIKAKDVVKLEISETEVYDVVNCKPGPVDLSEAIDPGYMMKSPKPRFVLRVFQSEKISVYKSKNDFFIFKPGEKAAVSVRDFSIKKKLAKMTSDCQVVSDKVANGEYKGIGKLGEEVREQVIQLATDYTNCAN